MRVEWLILADFVEIIGGKLYIMGGGWDKLTVNTGFPLTRSIGIAASFRVPWDETNEAKAVNIEIVTEDGGPVASIQGEVTVGRPALLPAGQEQRAQMAANLQIKFTEAKNYVINVRLEGLDEVAESSPFNVLAGPRIAGSSPPAASPPRATI